jgi:hypothetical protein
MTATTSTVSVAGSSSAMKGGRSRERPGEQGMALFYGTNNPRSKEWSKAVKQLNDLATEQQCELSLQQTKERLFSK